MDWKKRIKSGESEVRCFNIISDPEDRKFGETCNRLLCKVNSVGEVAGEIKCPRCGAMYDINGGFIILKELHKIVGGN